MFFSNKNNDIDQKAKYLNALAFMTLPHIHGLPVAENIWCILYYCEDKIVIEGNNITFNLPLQKIKDITIQTDIEIQKHIVSSVGGAIAGGVMFGALGAILGGRVQTKTTKTVTPYLIITYENEEVKYIMFDVTGTPKSKNFIELFNEQSKKETVINL